jgi:hypothetical protein
MKRAVDSTAGLALVSGWKGLTYNPLDLPIEALDPKLIDPRLLADDAAMFSP